MHPIMRPTAPLLDDIAGMATLKQALVESILWPRLHQATFRHYGIHSSGSGLLLFGPPGTGKTLIPQVVAKELGCSLLVVKLSEVVVGEVGSSEQRIVTMFADARKAAPSIVFIDEFQALFTSSSSDRGGSVSSLSSALAGCFDDIESWNSCMGADLLVTVIASTNEPWAIDRGFLRPGRLGKAIFLGPLDAAGRSMFLRRQLLRQYQRVRDHYHQQHEDGAHYQEQELKERLDEYVGVDQVVMHTEGFTGADLKLLLSTANQMLLLAQSEVRPENGFWVGAVPQYDHFLSALQEVKPSVSSQEIAEYTDWLADQNK